MPMEGEALRDAWLSEEPLPDEPVPIVERWLSHRTGEYAALARMPFSETAVDIRNQINEILSEKVHDQAQQGVFLEALNRYLGLRTRAAADSPIEPSSFQALQFSPRNVR